MSLERFLIKRADLSSILPAVAAPALGGFAGRMIGSRFGSPDVGMLLGGISGGTIGQLFKEKAEADRDAAALAAPPVPPGAPYDLDASSADIPPWALQGAQMVQPQMQQPMKQASSAGDWVLGEVPGALPIQRGIHGGLGQAGRAFAGMSLGGVGGSLAGLGVGKGIEHLIGHPVNVPGVNISLHELLAGVAGTIGATKGLQRLAPEKPQGLQRLIPGNQGA